MKLINVKPKSDDCIRRQDAINACWNGWGYDDETIKHIVENIVNLPPVTPAEKVGKWIDDCCSVCGKGIEDLIDSREWYRNEQPKFCPFCGVKLVDLQESEG